MPAVGTRGRALRGVVLAVVLATVILPIALGFWLTLRAAFGVLPAIGASGISLAPFATLWGLPGMGTSLWLTLFTGFGATILSLILAAGFCARIGPGGAVGRALAPLLASPHAAMAIGLGFLIAPSGWIARGLSPWATGWQVPPDLGTVHDPLGLALILGLMVKEVPFLLLMMLSARAQVPVRALQMVGRSLGYGPGASWVKLVFPQIYTLIRLPVLVVLAFSLSVVDVALVLGPSNPPTLAVAVLRWFSNPDLAMLLPASAGAVAIAGLIGGGVLLWLGAERGIAKLGQRWIAAGGRGCSLDMGLTLVSGLTLGLLTLGLASLIVLALWSVTWRWSFPRLLPERWSLTGWMTPDAGWGEAAMNTALIGGAATGLALLLAIAWLQAEDMGRHARARWSAALIYLPLMMPQIAFLFGLNAVLLRAGFGNGLGAVIWVHVIFVFPYVMIALSDPWRALDRRMLHTAAALGAGPLRRLVAIKLPVLLQPVLTAAAVGFAVSVAQYLPTLFMGGGRIGTLTTEAVTLSSGADRRIAGLYALLQAALPLAAFGVALILPAVVWRNRRALNGGARG